MPYLSIKTTRTLTLQQELALKESAGKLITLLPNKVEENLMMHIEDNQVMYFKGKEMDCCMMDLRLFGTIDFESKKKFTQEFMKSVAKITDVPVDNQYLAIGEFENWGKKGDLF